MSQTRRVFISPARRQTRAPAPASAAHRATARRERPARPRRVKRQTRCGRSAHRLLVARLLLRRDGELAGGHRPVLGHLREGVVGRATLLQPRRVRRRTRRGRALTDCDDSLAILARASSRAFTFAWKRAIERDCNIDLPKATVIALTLTGFETMRVARSEITWRMLSATKLWITVVR